MEVPEIPDSMWKSFRKRSGDHIGKCLETKTIDSLKKYK
jgi:hypothetical protein